MNEIKRNYKALIPGALWSWILCFIPTGIEALKIYFNKYTYDDNQIIVKTGVIHQSQQAISFLKLIDVKSTQNIIERLLQTGTISIYDKEKEITIKYVENPDEVAKLLLNLSLQAKRVEDVKAITLL